MNLLDFLFTFLKIGLFSFGGGYAVIPLIAAEVVQHHHWLTPSQFADLLALSQLTPGPLMVNAATFIGYRVAGVPGAVLGTLGVILPAFLLMLAITHYHQVFRDCALVRRLLRGLYPVVVALLAGAAFFFAQSTPFSWKVPLIAALACGVLATRRLDPFWVLVGAAFLGWLL
ncbi:MAG: chromate transporter [Firmicutes bacterium]|nr:chromate transporter [Bacillota bacterium]